MAMQYDCVAIFSQKTTKQHIGGFSIVHLYNG